MYLVVACYSYAIWEEEDLNTASKKLGIFNSEEKVKTAIKSDLDSIAEEYADNMYEACFGMSFEELKEEYSKTIEFSKFDFSKTDIITYCKHSFAPDSEAYVDSNDYLVIKL